MKNVTTKMQEQLDKMTATGRLYRVKVTGLATKEAGQLQQIADDNLVITGNFDQLLNNKK